MRKEQTLVDAGTVLDIAGIYDKDILETVCTQADSIMDRIIHNSYSIPTTDNNLRKLYDSQKARKLMELLNS